MSTLKEGNKFMIQDWDMHNRMKQTLRISVFEVIQPTGGETNILVRTNHGLYAEQYLLQHRKIFCTNKKWEE